MVIERLHTYDGAGNILTASNGSITHSYTYGNTDWKDLLTAFDGNSITYDAIGNPTSYYNGTRWTFGWENGRQLTTASKTGTSLSFAYDASGLRTGKTVGSTAYLYYYAGGKLMRQTWDSNTIDFFYDANGTPYAMKYNGTLYYYVTNLQGDVMRVVNASGTVVATYEYDPYGKVISATGTLANINPLRYRGYVYDTETGFYYLQSRYYDPSIGRFINADSYATTGQGILGHNMFAYCKNNPVSLKDDGGANAEAVKWWTGTMWWLCGADTVLPFGDIVYVLGIIALGGHYLYASSKSDEKSSALPETKAFARSIYTPDDRYVVHHIVAQQAPQAAYARSVLETVKIDPKTFGLNLAVIPEEMHRSMHTKNYYN